MNLRMMLALCVLSLRLGAATQLEQDKAFLESFINYYEFNTVGRYAHEYHPFLLKKTSHSFDELERHLGRQGFSINSRIVLTGYEERGVLRYFTNVLEANGAKINDEASSKSDAGWSQTLHNRFGLMTGFLFRRANELCESDNLKLCDHLNAHTIEIYDQRASVFQEDAFGAAYPAMVEREKKILMKLVKRDVNGVFDELIKFWQSLYFGCSKSGDKQVAGTQDILFTLEHARHLHRSTLPLRRYFVGPDITYPIDPSTRCLAEATTNAQQFVKKMVQELYPVNDQTTCYVFRSFVDGVGKSTMLGNIKNWMKHGAAIHLYEAVDNTSSQFAELFKFADKTFIADLPAQISHFTHKPDGLVYSDVQAEKLPASRLNELISYAETNKKKLIKEYWQLLTAVNKEVKEQGWHAPLCTSAAKPAAWFAKNVMLLKKEATNQWIPFTYQQHHYLFNSADTQGIRMLKPLALASSIGLKNAQSEQMLFTEGVRLPIPYQTFLKNFEDQLKLRGIKQIVFVDFLSMYPRSSRENIRINFLLQQMAMLDRSFTVENSFYRDFINNSELFYLLNKRKSAPLIIHGLKQEALTRLLLNRMMEENTASDLAPVALSALDRELRTRVSALNPELVAFLDTLLAEKLKREVSHLSVMFGMHREYLNMQSLSLANVGKFSDALEKLLGKTITDSRLNELWKGMGAAVDLDGDLPQGAVDETKNLIPMVGGDDASALFVIHPDSKNPLHLVPCMRLVRSQWYAALVNLVFYEEGQGSDQSCERFPTAPLYVKPSSSGMLYVVQRAFAEMQIGALKLDEMFKVANARQLRCGVFNGNYYPLNAQVNETHQALYGLGYDQLNAYGYGAPPYLTEVISSIVNEAHTQGDPDNALSASDVLEKSLKIGTWTHRTIDYLLQRGEALMKQGQGKKSNKAAQVKPNANEEAGEETKLNAHQNRENPLFTLMPQHRAGAQLFARAVATLEMILPDPESVVVIRKGNKQDFAAALQLVERVILPQFLRIVCKEPLFENYQAVEPLIPWHELETE